MEEMGRNTPENCFLISVAPLENLDTTYGTNRDNRIYPTTNCSPKNPEVRPQSKENPQLIIHKLKNLNFLKRLICCGETNEKCQLLLKYVVTYPLIILSIWAISIIFWGQQALPGGSVFALVALELLGTILGQLSNLFFLPPSCGMLLAGIILRNLAPYYGQDLPSAITCPLRGVCIAVLLARGAFSINLKNIIQFKATVLPLSWGSWISEALCIATSVNLLLGFSPSWSALTGSILAASSGPAITPYLTKLGDGSINKENMALTIAKTGCGLDAILAISVAECAFGFIFANDELLGGLRLGLCEVLLGCVYALGWGGAAGFLLSMEKDSSGLKILAILCGTVTSLLGLPKLGYPRGGPLGAFFGTLTSVNIWRFRGVEVGEINKVFKFYDILWSLVQPLLFGIIGVRTEFGEIDWNVIWKGSLCYGLGVMGKFLSSYFVTSCSNLSRKQRGFLFLASCGKGTLQAALGPVAMEQGVLLQKSHGVVMATNLMNLCTMVIFYSSVSLLLLKFLGPKMLRQ